MPAFEVLSRFDKRIGDLVQFEWKLPETLIGAVELWKLNALTRWRIVSQSATGDDSVHSSHPRRIPSTHLQISCLRKAYADRP